MWVWMMVALGQRAEVPLPDMNPGSTRWVSGPTDVSVGSALWQAATFGRSIPHWFPNPRVNVNTTVMTRVGGSPAVMGVHGAFQSIAYGPGGARRTQSIRVEPRIGFRVGRSERSRWDVTVGGAVDYWRQLKGAPVLAGTWRHWLGEDKRTFLTAEARVGLWLEASTTLQFCTEWCDQSSIVNPGGTGLLLGVGRTVGRRR